jgi:membrane associated rhomboid family serine protease
MSEIIKELKDTYKNGGTLMKLVFLNSAVFIVCGIVNIFYKDTVTWLAMPSNPAELYSRPWTLVTYMFFHLDPLHFFFNVLNLYWFGKMFLMYFDQKKLLSLYLLGGIAGGLFYFLVYNLFPARFSPGLLLGASASIMTMILALSFYAPNLKVMMIFIGEVKLIYVGLFFFVVSVILISSSNPGGNLAHIGGGLLGILWANQYRKGRDISKWFSNVIDWVDNIVSWVLKLFKRRKLKVAYKRPVDDYEFNRQKLNNQKEIDRILDKISKGGYDSLSSDEKDTLFRMGQK